MKEYKHLGVYGIVIKDNKILLIKKVTGPYDGLFDLPGGSFEFGEKPEEVLKREMMEEVRIEINDYELFDSDSVLVDWNRDGELIKVHHVGIFYKVNGYLNDIRNDISLDIHNDDSLGADFYDIFSLSRNQLSSITILVLEKLGYKLK